MLAVGVYGKTTYIPFYRSYISITENGVTKAVDGDANRLSLGTADNGIRFTILHEQVTKDKVRSIKSAKSSVGWSTIAVGLSQGRGTTEAVAGSAIINSAKKEAEEAQELSIELLIVNDTDEDIFIGDMNKGMGYWHIPSKGNLTVHLNNPDWFQLRVTNAYMHDNIERPADWKQRVAYVTLSASGHVEKKFVEFESDTQLIYAVEQDDSYDENISPVAGYALYDKQTSSSTPITKEEYKRIKNEKK